LFSSYGKKQRQIIQIEKILKQTQIQDAEEAGSAKTVEETTSEGLSIILFEQLNLSF
jgi:hypothetical protein